MEMAPKIAVITAHAGIHEKPVIPAYAEIHVVWYT